MEWIYTSNLSIKHNVADELVVPLICVSLLDATNFSCSGSNTCMHMYVALVNILWLAWDDKIMKTLNMW